MELEPLICPTIPAVRSRPTKFSVSLWRRLPLHLPKCRASPTHATSCRPSARERPLDVGIGARGCKHHGVAECRINPEFQFLCRGCLRRAPAAGDCPTQARWSDVMTDPVLIVGAGPTGLTAALELSRMGVPVRLIDK